MKTSELTGAALDWAVAKCEQAAGMNIREGYGGSLLVVNANDFGAPANYSTDWSQCGPIIEREGITTAFCTGDLGEPRIYWIATIEPQSWGYGYGPYHEQDDYKSLSISKTEVIKGTTPLIAAMRCYVASKLGDEVEIPNELLKD